jgi:hypothetical protein
MPPPQLLIIFGVLAPFSMIRFPTAIPKSSFQAILFWHSAFPSLGRPTSRSTSPPSMRWRTVEVSDLLNFFVTTHL